VSQVDEGLTSDDEAEVCIAEWVDMPKDNPITSTFLIPGPGKEEMRFMFDMTKCNKLFDVLLQNNMIRLKGGHIIPSVEQVTRRKYCKWHISFSHTTNKCNYFCWQIQSALNDGCFTLGDAHHMMLDVNTLRDRFWRKEGVGVEWSRRKYGREECRGVRWTEDKDDEAMVAW
jgi:hypothetical protein